MARYLIHTCNQRLWYVQQYLIPSMQEQGITDIDIYLDKNEDGCLESCMRSFLSVPDGNGGTWHLQDDVIICSDFKKRTEQYDDGVVCGYCYEQDAKKEIVGMTDAKNMWYSFPCIRIPNKIARGCANWFYREVVHNLQYQTWIKLKKYDDSIFAIYMDDYCDVPVLNLAPNLVDHVDYLIGGSIINTIRAEKETHSAYFEDVDLITKLELRLDIHKNNS